MPARGRSPAARSGGRTRPGSAPENDVFGNDVSGNNVSGNNAFGNNGSGNRQHVERAHMRLVLIAVLFVGSVATLITVGILQRGIPVLTFDQLLAEPSHYQVGSKVQVDAGRVVEVVSRAPDLVFLYGDPENPATAIRVESSRIAPDNFREGSGASLKGTYDPETRVFRAYEVATNCPSKYSAKDEQEEYLQKQQSEQRQNRLAPDDEAVRAAALGASPAVSDAVP